MIYNEKYDRYIDDDLVIYRWSKTLDKLVQVKPYKSKKGYICITLTIKPNYYRPIFLHRVIWETFNGDIPDGYEIDHINTIKTDNKLENLRLITHKENCNNPLTRKHNSEAKLNNQYNKGKIKSIFGKKFFEHFGITRNENIRLYNREYYYFIVNGKCSWEI